jgi:hypothetical protein|tara:strand:- start:18006 stop:18422 length:417 start_codon:yes stop_codon:yes gene_type:complete
MVRKSWRQRCLDNPDIMFKRALNSAKNRSLGRDTPFDIDVPYLMDLYSGQDGMCFYSGIDMNIVKRDPLKTHDPFKMTLDCIVPELGYVKGNVVWCAYCVNTMKQKMPLDQMLKVCTSIARRSDEVRLGYKRIKDGNT